MCVCRQKQGVGLDQIVTMTNKSPRWNEQVRLVHHPHWCLQRLMTCTVAVAHACELSHMLQQRDQFRHLGFARLYCGVSCDCVLQLRHRCIVVTSAFRTFVSCCIHAFTCSFTTHMSFFQAQVLTVLKTFLYEIPVWQSSKASSV